MALHIKDPKADRLARDLAKLTGESLTGAVTKAIEERLAREARAKTKEQRLRAVLDMLREVDAQPILDQRSDEEILGYDEHGLPT